MSFPAGAYIYEFLYRGQPSGAAQPPAYHVIAGVPGTDPVGNATVAFVGPMTPDQATAQGLALPDMISGFNTATTAQAAALQAELTTAQTQVTSLQAQVTDLKAQIASLTAAPSGTKLTFMQFQALFTPAEETAIMTAAQSTPALMLWLLKAAGAQFIDLSDSQTKAGLDALVAVGVLTADREAVILAGTPPS